MQSPPAALIWISLVGPTGTSPGASGVVVGLAGMGVGEGIVWPAGFCPGVAQAASSQPSDSTTTPSASKSAGRAQRSRIGVITIARFHTSQIADYKCISDLSIAKYFAAAGYRPS